jgi:uncharacterized protein
MGNWKRLLTIAVIALAILTGIALAVGISLVDFIIDYWWFNSLDYGNYFWLRVLYRYILSGGVTVFFFLIFFLNFWAASRFLGVDDEALTELAEPEEIRATQSILALFQTGSLRVYTPLSLILAVMVAAPFYHHWEDALLFLFGPESAVRDPVFGESVSFYLFRLPIFDLVQHELQLTSSILVIAIAILYWITHKLIPGDGLSWPMGARVHISILVFVTALIAAWGFILDEHDLLYVDTHEPIYFGPGFIELRYLLPLIWLAAIALMVGSGFAIAYMQSGKGLKGLVASVLLFVLAVVLRNVDFVPKALDRFLVKPNPVKVERVFMENNIKATQAGYGLDRIKEVDMTAAQGTDLLDPHLREQLHNIPVWDPEFLDDVYQQLQGIRPYYHFSDADVGRYKVNGRIEQVNLSAREVNLERLPAEAQNWENRHLRYTHGYGAVVSPAAQSGDEPMKWFLRDLNLQSDVGITIEKPDIYFGTESLDYALVPNRLDIVDISSFDLESSRNYSGSGGIPISSLVRKFLVALHLRDEKLFFSLNIDGNSKLQIRRNIVERIKSLTPYLALDQDPYLVVTPKRLYWIQDAYTTSNWYPVSKTTQFQFKSDAKPTSFNYIRNSVKVVVDAFDGTVDYFVSEPSDPIIQGYRSAYPGLFKDVSAMPPLLREQLRFPRDMFSISMGIYAKYHQSEAALFYQQAETWDFAKIDQTPVKPYYLTTYLEGFQSLENFVLLGPMTPIGRENLSALAIAGNVETQEPGPDYKQGVVIYKFSREVQVDGPAQVSALIDQDPEISRLFSLWDQRGSHVQRGRIIVLPVGRSLVYVQPIYLVSTGNIKIPELTRVIVSMGNIVVMDTSLELAVDRLEGRIREMQPELGKPGAPATVPKDARLPSAGPSAGPTP